MLIISDRASNVNRMMRIISRIDQAGDADIEVIPLQNATAAEVVRVVNYADQPARAAAKAPATRCASSPTSAPTACSSAARSRSACASRR